MRYELSKLVAQELWFPIMVDVNLTALVRLLISWQKFVMRLETRLM